MLDRLSSLVHRLGLIERRSLERRLERPQRRHSARERLPHPLIRLLREPRDQIAHPQPVRCPEIHLLHPQHPLPQILQRMLPRAARNRRFLRLARADPDRRPQLHVRHRLRQEHAHPHQLRQPQRFRDRPLAPPRKLIAVLSAPRIPHRQHLVRDHRRQRQQIVRVPRARIRQRRQRLLPPQPEQQILHRVQPPLRRREDIHHRRRVDRLLPAQTPKHRLGMPIRRIVRVAQPVADQRLRAPIHRRPEPHRLRARPRAPRVPPRLLRLLQIGRVRLRRQRRCACIQRRAPRGRRREARLDHLLRQVRQHIPPAHIAPTAAQRRGAAERNGQRQHRKSDRGSSRHMRPTTS